VQAIIGGEVHVDSFAKTSLLAVKLWKRVAHPNFNPKIISFSFLLLTISY
jgi:hypothetical protein